MSENPRYCHKCKAWHSPTDAGWKAGCVSELSPARGSAPVFALSYDDLQEIHTLAGMVCVWKMSLPTKMICQAQEVSRRMINLRQVKAHKQ